MFTESRWIMVTPDDSTKTHNDDQASFSRLRCNPRHDRRTNFFFQLLIVRSKTRLFLHHSSANMPSVERCHTNAICSSANRFFFSRIGLVPGYSVLAKSQPRHWFSEWRPCTYQ